MDLVDLSRQVFEINLIHASRGGEPRLFVHLEQMYGDDPPLARAYRHRSRNLELGDQMALGLIPVGTVRQGGIAIAREPCLYFVLEHLLAAFDIRLARFPPAF